jgi:nascent polypeptide-associated complex subunit alpha
MLPVRACSDSSCNDKVQKMIPGVNPRQMQQMMRRMGISQVEVDATEVIIKTKDKIFTFNNPQVSKVNMMGQMTYQVVGNPVEESINSAPEITEEDIATVVEKTGKSKEEAIKAIADASGDLAEAIMKLSN